MPSTCAAWDASSPDYYLEENHSFVGKITKIDWVKLFRFWVLGIFYRMLESAMSDFLWGCMPPLESIALWLYREKEMLQAVMSKKEAMAVIPVTYVSHPKFGGIGFIR